MRSAAVERFTSRVSARCALRGCAKPALKNQRYRCRRLAGADVTARMSSPLRPPTPQRRCRYAQYALSAVIAALLPIVASRRYATSAAPISERFSHCSGFFDVISLSLLFASASSVSPRHFTFLIFRFEDDDYLRYARFLIFSFSIFADFAFFFACLSFFFIAAASHSHAIFFAVSMPPPSSLRYFRHFISCPLFAC